MIDLARMEWRDPESGELRRFCLTEDQYVDAMAGLLIEGRAVVDLGDGMTATIEF